jgi:tocopherol cyclase
MKIDKIGNPILFQGNLKNKDYFEGWYFKFSSMKDGKAISFIPGISLSQRDPHCFIQYIFVRNDENGEKTVTSDYVRYSIDEFELSEGPFKLKIRENTFTETNISITIKSENYSDGRGMEIKADFDLGILHPIKMSLFAPNIMGIFAYIPKMECYHGIVSMNHKINGTLKIDNKETEFWDGKGYIEKDWGTSFPTKYIWLQCNNFGNKDTSIFCSVAHIPFLGLSFQGYICNFVINSEEYRYATYNNSSLKIENVTKDKIVLTLENAVSKLSIEAYTKNVGKLVSPKLGKMEDVVKEELSGEIKIRFLNKKSGDIHEDYGYMAGIENMGFNKQLDKKLGSKAE